MLLPSTNDVAAMQREALHSKVSQVQRQVQVAAKFAHDGTLSALGLLNGLSLSLNP